MFPSIHIIYVQFYIVRGREAYDAASRQSIDGDRRGGRGAGNRPRRRYGGTDERDERLRSYETLLVRKREPKQRDQHGHRVQFIGADERSG